MYECCKELEKIKQSKMFDEEIKIIEKYIKDIESEKWLVISNLETHEISNLGRIRNIKTKKIRKPSYDKDGYEQLEIYRKNKWKLVKVHRLVAIAFVPNPNCKEQVNHINGDKTDNRAINLEWVTCKENINHAWRTGLYNTKKWNQKFDKQKKPVAQLDNNGNIIATYESVVKAAKAMGLVASTIVVACNNPTRTAKGYHWRFLPKGDM